MDDVIEWCDTNHNFAYYFESENDDKSVLGEYGDAAKTFRIC